MLVGFRRLMQRSGDGVSPFLGLSFAALYIGAVIAVWFVAAHAERTKTAEHRVAERVRWVEALSQNLARVSDTQAVGRELRQIARQEGTRFAAIVSPAGVAVAHSDVVKANKPMPDVAWGDGPVARSRVGADPGLPGSVIISSRMGSATGEASANSLWVGLSPIPIRWTQSDLIIRTGYILLAVMGLYLLLYRHFRKSVEPLDVIRRRLLGCDEAIAERLTALRLNDSFDQVSVSWNRIIELVCDMQEQLRKSKLVTDVSGAMDGYQSERLTSILMQIPFGVLVVGKDGNISFANRAASGMLTGAGESLEGVCASNVLDESLRVALLSSSAAVRGTAAAPSRWTDHTFHRPHGDSTLRFWSLTGEGGEHVVFVQDVTQAKEAERARDQFLYHVTHELRTPLTNIRAYAETLSQGVVEDEQTLRECYNVIMGETQRLNRLVEDILNVSQLEVGTARLDVGDVQIDRLIRNVVQDTQGKADAKNIDLVLSLPAKIPQVRGDKERLAVVLTNLVGNAVKYTPEGGRIEVRCSWESGRLRISVSDTGIGIREEDQEKIFEKFYRVNDERVAAIPGTGLGLAIVKETVRLHGGAVFVESSPGQGTTFTVTLPASDVDDDDQSAGQGLPAVERI